MKTDTSFWRDMEARFQALPDPTGDMHALYHGSDGGQWLVWGGPADDTERGRLHNLFDSLAERAGIAAGAPDHKHARDYWLEILRRKNPPFEPRDSWSVVNDVESWRPSCACGARPLPRKHENGIIEKLCLASADLCVLFETEAFAEEHTGKEAEADTAAQPRPARLPSSINSPRAAKRMEAYIQEKGLSQTDFAMHVRTTDRTLLHFRRTGNLRRTIFTRVAEEMGTTQRSS